MSNTTFPNGCSAPDLSTCTSPGPFPDVRVKGPNLQYAQLLLDDYAGQVSETTAITQYLYQHRALEPENQEVSDLLLCVSMVEMHHQEVLGDLIVKLGMDPRFRTIGPNNVETYWDASYITYGTGLCDRIAADIASEWAAIASYRKHQSLINDPFIKAILEKIILDELCHINLFNQVMCKYCQP
ncbi:MAG: manganese catalase family protein [Firmicutes bacterium]|nr:manganese catalase family protein [Bacillota bacterium]